MSNVIIYDPATGAVKQYLESVNTPDYEGKPGVLVNPDATILKTVQLEYVKVTGGLLKEMTVAEKEIIDAAKPIPVPDPLIKINADIEDLKTRVSALEKP